MKFNFINFISSEEECGASAQDPIVPRRVRRFRTRLPASRLRHSLSTAIPLPRDARDEAQLAVRSSRVQRT